MSRVSPPAGVADRLTAGWAIFALMFCVSLLPGCASRQHEPVGTAASVEEVEAPSVIADAEGADTQPVPAGDLPETPPAIEDPLAEAEDPAEIFAGEELSESPLDDLGEVVPEIPAAVAAEVPAAPVPISYDIPMITNEKVGFWLDYYSAKRRDHFLPGMERSGHYLPMFREIFEEAGLPLDLIYMAHVESAFKTSAYSKAKAKGIWQFMPATGRHYGLKIDYWVDERSDPEKSARAAATYLKKLYRDFGDWYLAMAAYNAGEGKIRRGLRNTGTDNFWSLARTRAIRRETKNYLPAILAAIQIYKDPARFGIDYAPKEELDYETVQVDGAVDLRVLAECSGSSYEELKFLNPALRRQQTPPNAVTDVRVPFGRADQTQVALRDIPKNERVLYARHQVRRGDTLSTIARAYGVSVSSVQQTNAMGRRTMIRVGQVLQVPSSAAARHAAPPSVAANYTPGEPLTHRVRRGDTLSGIGRRYGTSASAIADANGISTRSILQLGQRLAVVPGARYAAAPVASTPAVQGEPAADGSIVRYKVRRGDTLTAIARSFDTTPRAIAAANAMSTRKMLRIGESLIVTPGISNTVQARKAASPADAGSSGAVHYTVRRGDSLWLIASSFRTTVDQLCSINSISESKTLYPGMRLRVE